jgi:site-specific recombinase XerD
MIRSNPDATRLQLNSAYHRESPFQEERIRYLNHLLAEGWATNTVTGIACRLAAFACRVDINACAKISREAIEAAAKDWMSQQPGRPFCRALGPHKSKSRFIYAATNWLRFLGRLEEETGQHHLPHADLVEEFTKFLRNERGLSQATIDLRHHYIRLFLQWFDDAGGELSKVSLRSVDEFLASRHARHWNRVTIGICITGLRAFFHYARSKGRCPGIFADAIEKPRQYTAEGLPSGPSWDDVRTLISGIGREQAADIRARAILMLASIYGFRNSEIRQLRLDDLDWERDLITLHRSKQRRDQLYPLVKEVGEAIALYLQKVRPQTDRREVFLRLLPPFEPLTAGGLGALVCIRLKRLNLKLQHYGPHALRHACASHLLAEGFSLKEISDHLGHRDPRSTLVYAKVDIQGLRKVADFDLGGLL